MTLLRYASGEVRLLESRIKMCLYPFYQFNADETRGYLKPLSSRKLDRTKV